MTQSMERIFRVGRSIGSLILQELQRWVMAYHMPIIPSLNLLRAAALSSLKVTDCRHSASCAIGVISTCERLITFDVV